MLWEIPLGGRGGPCQTLFLGTAASSSPVLTCGNNARKQPAGDYFGERRNISGVSLSRPRAQKHAVTSLCTLKQMHRIHHQSPRAASQQRAKESPVPDFQDPNVPALLGCIAIFFYPPLLFFFPVYLYWDVGPPIQCVCVCGTRSWKEFCRMIGFPCQALTNTPTSYGIPSHAAEDVAPSCLFPVKPLIWKQTQCLRWCLEAAAGIRGVLVGVARSGATGKRKKDTQDAFYSEFKSDLVLTPTLPKQMNHVCGILIGQDFLLWQVDIPNVLFQKNTIPLTI